MSDHLVWNVIRPEAPDSFEENPQADPQWEWAKEPEVRAAVRPQVAELARVATFLASEGKTLNAAAYALFVDAVSDNLLLAITLLERRANGDYSPDDTPDSFPAFTDGPVRGSGVSCWELFEAFVTAKKPKPNTVSRWRAVFLEMQRKFEDVGAEGIMAYYLAHYAPERRDYITPDDIKKYFPQANFELPTSHRVRP
jgi:hypothetical protein